MDSLSTFAELLAIVKKLRDPQGGCPWDLEQTHASLKPYVIEEAFEVVDAIDEGPQKLREELGDLLLQVVLHAQIASESHSFAIADVVQGISKKLVDRHPHVFGEKKVSGSGEVLKNWEKIKQEERKGKESVIDGVPRAMPSLLRAVRLGEKAARVGFDWAEANDVVAKVKEEVAEFCEASKESSKEHLTEEFGDLLFVLSQWARKLGINAEDALRVTNDKFTKRFKHMEANAGKPLSDLSTQELERLWEQAKRAP